MSKKATEFQRKAMSWMYRGKEIFKPLNTGWIDENVACVREWVANIFFYHKGDTTIMVDAGYNYDRLAEKMSWLGIDPKSIHHILITHQDTDHVGAVEADSPGLFRNANLYIGEIENRYLIGETRRKVIYHLYKLPQVTIYNEKQLLHDGEVFDIDGVRIECFLVPGHTWGHMVYLIDDKYLFTATRCGLARTAATASFPRWRRTISWLCSHWRSWSGNCAHVGCIHISSPVTRDGRTILPLCLPTKTSTVHHSKNEYMTHRHPMMPTTNRTTPKKMQRAVF